MECGELRSRFYMGFKGGRQSGGKPPHSKNLIKLFLMFSTVESGHCRPRRRFDIWIPRPIMGAGTLMFPVE